MEPIDQRLDLLDLLFQTGEVGGQQRGSDLQPPHWPQIVFGADSSPVDQPITGASTAGLDYRIADVGCLDFLR
jgi:hypothetical protein